MKQIGWLVPKWWLLKIFDWLKIDVFIRFATKKFLKLVNDWIFAVQWARISCFKSFLEEILRTVAEITSKIRRNCTIPLNCQWKIVSNFCAVTYCLHAACLSYQEISFSRHIISRYYMWNAWLLWVYLSTLEGKFKAFDHVYNYPRVYLCRAVALIPVGLVEKFTGLICRAPV